ncbi:hypothetical protein [Pseudomonas sp. P5_A2_2]
MHTFQLRTRRATLCSVLVAAAVSVGLLGGAAALFARAGSTPTFMAGSKSAQEAAQCPDRLSQARHECLRNIAAAAPRSPEQGATLVARAPGKSN